MKSVAVAVLLLCLVAGCGGPATLSQSAASPAATKHYSDAEAGVSFDYPDYLQLQPVQRETVEQGGGSVTTSVTYGASQNPPVGIGLRVAEGHQVQGYYPGAYPPTDSLLRDFVSAEIRNVNAGTVVERENAALAGGREAEIGTVDGHPAALFTASVRETGGTTYIRGAVLMTETKALSLMVLGAVVPNTQGYVQPELIDQLWSQIIESLQVDE